MEYPDPDLPEHKKAIWEGIKSFAQKFNNNEVDYTQFPTEESKGYRFIPLFSPETARRFFEDIEIEKDFVLIATYPKTGTMWTYEIVRHILYGHDEKLLSLSKNLPVEFQMLCFGCPGKMDILEHLPLPRKFFATHLPVEFINFEKLRKANGKIIVVVRNPKDQALSWFHFVNSNAHFDSIRGEMSSKWPEFLQDYVAGKHPTISKPGEWYPEYLRGWCKHKNDGNVIFVHYENMKKDPITEISRMADFLDVSLTEERLKEIAAATSFDSMKKEEISGENEFSKLHANLKVLRQGKAGTWRNTFTVAQSEMMDKIIEEKLGDEIEFLYG